MARRASRSSPDCRPCPFGRLLTPSHSLKLFRPILLERGEVCWVGCQAAAHAHGVCTACSMSAFQGCSGRLQPSPAGIQQADSKGP